MQTDGRDESGRFTKDNTAALGLTHDSTPHEDQSNVPEGQYRTVTGRMSWVKGYSGNPDGRVAGSENITSPWFTGELQLSDIERLQALTKSQLIALMTKLGGIIGYALKSEEEIDEAMMLKLAYSGLTENQVHKYLPAIREYYDRRKGKPAQSISMDVKDTRMDKLPIDKLLRLAGMLDEPVVVLPPPE